MAGDEGFRAESAAIAEELRAQLPPECRAMLGPDAQGFAAGLDGAARDGIDAVLARLRAGQD